METNNTLLCVIAWENPGKVCKWQIIETGGASEVIGEVEADKLSGNYSNHH